MMPNRKREFTYVALFKCSKEPLFIIIIEGKYSLNKLKARQALTEFKNIISTSSLWHVTIGRRKEKYRHCQWVYNI